MLGGYILYIGTFNIYVGGRYVKNKYKFFYIKRLQFLCTDFLHLPQYTEKTENEMDRIERNFRRHVNKLSSNDIQTEKEKLLYHIEQQHRRLETSLSKANAFTTAILAIIPMVTITIHNQIKEIIVGIDIYILLNICIFIFEIIKVSGYRQSTFADLKKAPDKDQEIVIQYYYDCQNLKLKAELIVNYVGNLQEWIIFAIPMLGCTYLFLN